MKTQRVKISEIKQNPDNPRVIQDHKFHDLVQSIKNFPQMLDLRPIVVNSDMIVLGGNMRLKACKKAGLKEVPVIIAGELSEEQQREFIIKDNVPFGEWDWNVLAEKWETESLVEWGLDVFTGDNEELDYSILENEEVDADLEEMTNQVRKAIMIEFSLDDYQTAFDLIKHFREKGQNVGKMLIKFLQDEKKGS